MHHMMVMQHSSSLLPSTIMWRTALLRLCLVAWALLMGSGKVAAAGAQIQAPTQQQPLVLQPRTLQQQQQPHQQQNQEQNEDPTLTHDLMEAARIEAEAAELEREAAFIQMPVTAELEEAHRDETTVTFARKDKKGNVRSITMQQEAHEFNEDAHHDADDDEHSSAPSFLSTQSRARVGGACGKPLCKTIGPWQEKCEKSVCFPLCLSSMMDITVKGTGPNEQFNSELEETGYATAIQGVLLGIGCSEHTGCCEKNEELARWTESKLSGHNQYSLPTPFCKFMGNRTEACQACKVDLQVTARGEAACERFFEPPPIVGGEEAFKRAQMQSTPPAHKSYKERCKAVVAEVQGAVGAMQSAFKGYVCGCLGCCDDQKCPYKLAFSNVGEALSNSGGTGLDA